MLTRQPIAAVAGKIKAKTAYIDGEVVVLDDAGVSDFGGLPKALSERQAERLIYFALLHLDGRDLMNMSLVERKAKLEDLIGAFRGPIHFSEHVLGKGPEFFRGACKTGLEGIVSKRAEAAYRSGRGGDLLKTKCTKRQEVVIGGWRLSAASPREIGSILVGYYDGGKLRFAAGVGTGYTARMRRELLMMLQRLSRETSPFAGIPRAEARRLLGRAGASRRGRFHGMEPGPPVAASVVSGLEEGQAWAEVRAERPRVGTMIAVLLARIPGVFRGALFRLTFGVPNSECSSRGPAPRGIWDGSRTRMLALERAHRQAHSISIGGRAFGMSSY